MQVRKLAAVVLMAAPLVLAGVVTAGATTGTDGPYSYSSTDNGQCGNAWANETGNRSFTQGGSGTTNTIRETFTQVHWSTIAGLAPGDLQPNEDGSCTVAADTVSEGVTGTMHGYEVIVVHGAPYVAGNGSCNGGSGPCTTDSYIAYHYPGNTGYDVTSYKFTYKARNSGTLSDAIANDLAWVENCPTACANNGYNEQNYSSGNIATTEP